MTKPKLITVADFATKSKERHDFSEDFTGQVSAKLSYLYLYRQGLKQWLDTFKIHNEFERVELGRMKFVGKKYSHHCMNKEKYALIIQELNMMDREIARLSELVIK